MPRINYPVALLAACLCMLIYLYGQASAHHDDWHANYEESLERRCHHMIYATNVAVIRIIDQANARLQRCLSDRGLPRYDPPRLEPHKLAPGMPQTCESAAEVARRNQLDRLAQIEQQIELHKC